MYSLCTIKLVMVNLQRVRKEIMNNFRSSRCWTPWNWIKYEWLLTKKNGRIDFLLGCKRQKVVPRFVQNRIRTQQLLRRGGHRAVASERNFGLQVLALVIREEFQNREKLRKRAVAHRQNMECYSKVDYLFTRNLKDQVVNRETTESRKRLAKKLRNLVRNSPSAPETRRKERVTCIDVEISESERTLLERGPKFVPTRKKLTESDLRSVESSIENAINSLRWTIDNVDTANQGNTKRGSIEKSAEEEGETQLLMEPRVQRLRSTTQRARQPPKMDVETERRSCDLKARILHAYQQYHPRQSNITKEEKSAIRTLKNRENTIIKCSDKSKSLVVVNRDTYLTKVDLILADTETYEKTDMTAETLEKIVSKELKKIKGLKSLPQDVYKGLFPTDTRLPEFYGLPKIHKENAPLRPVVAAFDGPLTPISVLLERVIHQLLKFVPSHIENTAAAVSSLKKTLSEQNPPDQKLILCTMDVVAMYPSIPIDDGTAAVIEKLNEHRDDIDTAGLTCEEIRSLLQLVLNNNYFKFGGKVFRQKKGVAMGNHLAPPLAIVFMDQLERRMLQRAELRPESYDRYVDDCIMVWKHGEANLQRFVDHCNQQHPSICFTWESTAQGNPVSYMDLKLSLEGDNQLVYELYQKPTDSGVNLNFESGVPQNVKMSVAVQQFLRANTLSSSTDTRQRSENKIRVLLRENGFPDSIIERANSKARETQKGRVKDNEKPVVTLRLPFCSDSLDKVVRRSIKKSGLPIRITYDRAQTLKSMLVRSALVPTGCVVHEKYAEQQQRERKRRGKPRDDCISCQAGIRERDCEKKGAVYLLKCKFCPEEYVGESQRSIRTRLQEHQADARKRSKDTPWGEHMMRHMDAVIGKEPVFTANILAIEQAIVRRKVREAIEIRDRKPMINKNRGWRLD